MPTAGELGPRRNGMPRVQSAPEVNIIQNPALTRGVARMAGARQAHVMPALSEGLQAVLITGDLREEPRTGLPRSYAAMHETVPDGANVKRSVFGNPQTSNRIAVLRRLHIYGAPDWVALNAPELFVYDLVPITPVNLGTITPGQRLVSGYTPIGGVVQNPDNGADITFPPGPASCGWKGTDINGIAGGYFWEGAIGGAYGTEILENFDHTTGPRIIIFPGGTVEFYALSTDFHGYLNMWWDEYPIT